MATARAFALTSGFEWNPPVMAKLGQKVRWSNDQTRVSYVLTPLAAVKGDPIDCRRYTLQASADGKSRKSEGRACRTGDGTWAIK